MKVESSSRGRVDVVSDGQDKDQPLFMMCRSWPICSTKHLIDLELKGCLLLRWMSDILQRQARDGEDAL